MKHILSSIFILFLSLLSNSQNDPSSVGSSEYTQVKPYLKFRDGRLMYYDRVGYNVDFYMAYQEDGSFEKVRHADVEAGCLNKKQEMYEFRMGLVGSHKKQLYLRESTRDKLFIIAHQDSVMILCTGMMHSFTGTRSSYATSVVGTNSMGAKTASTNEKYYFAVGQLVYPITFSSEDVQLWKQYFTQCSTMIEAFKIYDGLNDASEQSIMELMNALGDAYYNDCYVRLNDE